MGDAGPASYAISLPDYTTIGVVPIAATCHPEYRWPMQRAYVGSGKTIIQPEAAMHRPHVVDFREKELAALNANAEASFVIDEDAWEDATDESGVDCEMLCHSQWRASTLDSVD